jgi:hypothetical protein
MFNDDKWPAASIAGNSAAPPTVFSARPEHYAAAAKPLR